jgi:hypothetical protein
MDDGLIKLISTPLYDDLSLITSKPFIKSHTNVVSRRTSYLSSTSTHRSLTYDYPNLERLYIVVRSSIQLGTPGNNLFEAYKRWTASRNLNILLESIKNQAKNIKVKILFVRFATRGDELALLESIPDDFDVTPKGTIGPGPRLRTYWKSMHGSQVALDGTVENSPWITGHLF